MVKVTTNKLRFCTRITLSLVVTAIVVAFFMACDKTKRTIDFNPEEINHYFEVSDSIPRTADSLLSLGIINQIAADVFLVEYYADRDVPRAVEIVDSGLALPVLTDQDRYYNFLLNSESVEIEVLARRYESGLHKVQPLVEKADMDFVNSHYRLQSAYINLCLNMAKCDINLERFDQAEEQLQRAMNLLDGYIEAARNDSIKRGRFEFDRAYTAVETLIAYFNINQYERSLSWVERAEKYQESFLQHPGNMKQHCTTFTYQIAIMKAADLAKTGRPGRAARVYDNIDFQNNPFADSPVGRVNAVNYLLFAHRYNEAVRNIEPVEDMIRQHGMEMTLDNLVGFVKMKFEANMGAGHRDSALAVATRLIMSLDSARAWAKRDRSAEMTTLHDIKEKEAQLAEKEESLRYTRVIAIIIALSLLIIFFMVFSIIRHRAAKRLEALNQKLEEANAQLEQNNEQLMIANARAGESSRMKTNFIQQISHEIRTPLNILSGFAQILTTNDMNIDEAMRKNANRQILENTDRITGLVNKMLELSDASSRTVIEQKDHVQVMQIANEAVQASGIGNTKQLVFELQSDEDTSSTTLTTNLRTAVRVLSLILDNARKFTVQRKNHKQEPPTDKEQRVTLRINNNEGNVQFIVEDTGVGVPATEAEHIFDEFVQLNDYYDGTGIGLTIARNLARSMGGDVVLDTSYTSGARFVMTLPLRS